MSRAEEIHYKAVIAADNQEPPKDYAISAHADHFNGFVEGFVEGYQQAEKDNELTWKDIQKIDVLIYAVLDEEKYKRYYTQDRDGDFYEEVLKRFNKERKEK